MIHINWVPVKNFSRLEQNAQLRQGSPDPVKGSLIWAGKGEKVNPFREIGGARGIGLEAAIT